MRWFCQTLDEECFRILAERYYDQGVRVARDRFGRDSAAHDAVQEALIRVVRYRRRYDPSQAFAPWFYTILQNVCIDAYRSEARYKELMETFSVLNQPGSPDTAVSERARDLSASLPPEDADLLQMRFTEGLSLAEISHRLGCSLAAAKKRVQRLIQRLKP